MQVDLRRHRRKQTGDTYALCWNDDAGLSYSVSGQGQDISSSGVCLISTIPIATGTVVFLQGPDNSPHGYAAVRHCTRSGTAYRIGLELSEEAKATLQIAQMGVPDYYEFLQINPRAEPATIHRIYRFMAARFHPDNPTSGDPEAFLLLNRIYETLSDPQRRAAYDETRQTQDAEPEPICEVNALISGIEGEVNRRLAILALLYNKRRTNPQDPSISLWDLERKVSVPREYLDFATWYLKSKSYISVADNSDFALTALGVDYVEANAENNQMLHKLLNAGVKTATDFAAAQNSLRVAREFIRLGSATTNGHSHPAGDAEVDGTDPARS